MNIKNIVFVTESGKKIDLQRLSKKYGKCYHFQKNVNKNLLTFDSVLNSPVHSKFQIFGQK